jgi:murein DD-endopeptidase MepM/ murein hydrolase activator NlpD
MSINTSLRFLVITGAFLSAEAVLAHNSLSNVQVSVANNTLKTQFSDVNRIANPDAVNIQLPQSNRPIATDIGDNLSTEDRSGSIEHGTQSQQTEIVAKTATPAEHSPESLRSRSSGDVAIANTQITVFSSDVATIGRNPQIISVQPATQSEASVVIPVPPPLTRTIKVQSVTRLPRAVKPKAIPSVIAMPDVQPTTDGTAPVLKPTAFGNNSTTESNSDPIYPLMNPARITSRFGWRTHPLTGARRFHSGLDIGAPSGTPVVATAAGTIISAGWNGGYGKAIIIQHNGVQQTLYGHLSEISVEAGQTIEQGTVIGLVGSTGNSTGPHLHFESRMSTSNGWIAVDPSDEIQYAVDNLRRSMPFARRDLPPGL